MIRKDIWEFRDKIRSEKNRIINEDWIRMYENLLNSLDHADACFARSEDYDKKPENIISDGKFEISIKKIK